jgi:phosphate transport system permease protein
MIPRNPFRRRKSTTGPRPAHWGDRIFTVLTGLGAAAVVGLAVMLVVVLYYGARPTIELFGLRFLFITIWSPAGSPVNPNVYGIVPFIIGTLVTSAIALLIGIPLSLGAAIFLTQQAPVWLRRPVGQVIEMLAAIPSIIFGFWGLVVLVPIMRLEIEPALARYLGWTGLFSATPIGLDILTASVVLSIMIIPTITAISRDTIATVPTSQKEAALSLGATDWEVTRNAVLPYARTGIIAGIVLGLGRALGETMAVTLVIGNSNHIPLSLFSQGQTISSLIANQFTEASGPLELSALIEAGLILFILTLAINLGARGILSRFESGRGVGEE